ncbi:hypothetical protein [Pendulispora albinea]|uniref:Secreted protein n=1 Tax=Pendulispora albinea TaxID=2741071 RepID=A0ABZ2LX66_9BACT
MKRLSATAILAFFPLLAGACTGSSGVAGSNADRAEIHASEAARANVEVLSARVDTGEDDATRHGDDRSLARKLDLEPRTSRGARAPLGAKLRGDVRRAASKLVGAPRPGASSPHARRPTGEDVSSAIASPKSHDAPACVCAQGDPLCFCI